MIALAFGSPNLRPWPGPVGPLGGRHQSCDHAGWGGGEVGGALASTILGLGQSMPVDDPLQLIGIGPDELVAGHSAGLCTVLRGKLTA